MKLPYTVSRSIIIQASPRKIYTVAKDMKQAEKWSPWFVMDAKSKPQVQGDGKKVGSIHSWDSVLLGSGEQEIVELKQDKLIRHELRFFRPWRSTAQARMTFKKLKTGTKVTWELDSTLPAWLFPMKKMMQALIGADYDRGLLMLKDYLETGEVHSKVAFKGEQTMEGFSYIGKIVSGQSRDIEKIAGKEFQNLWKWAEKNSVQLETVFTMYHKWDISKGAFKATVGVGVKDKPASTPEGFKYQKLSGGKAFVTEHKGAYKHLANAWTAAMMYQRTYKLKKGKGDPLEVYLNDPREVQTKNIRTAIYLPIK